MEYVEESPSRTNCDPIFIGGLSHCGKTLLRRMLEVHPALAFTRRTYFWRRFYGRYGNLRHPRNFEACFRAMLAQPAIRRLTTEPERIRREFWQGEPSYARLFALFHEHYTERLGKQRWGDQTAHIERYAGPIFAAYPGARILHMIRDPRDRYEEAAIQSRRLPGKVGWEAAAWRFSSRLAQRNQERYRERYLIVPYEALVGDREGTLRQVCAFLGEPFLPEMLGSENDLVASPAPHSGIRAEERPQRKWRLTQALVGEEMRLHGYHPRPFSLSSREQLLYALWEWPASWMAFLAHRFYVGLCRGGNRYPHREELDALLSTDSR